MNLRLAAFPWGLMGMGLLFLLLLASLFIMGDAAQNSVRFEQLFLWLLAFHALILVTLGSVILLQFGRLVVQFRDAVPGSRLTLRLVLGFVLVAVPPVTVVYYFSYRFLNEGVDSWFDVRVEGALQDALELSRSSLDLRVRQLSADVQEIMRQLESVPESRVPLLLNDLRLQMAAQELTLVGPNNRIIASSTDSPLRRLPLPPGREILQRMSPGQPFARVEEQPDGRLLIRVVATVRDQRPGPDSRILQGFFPVDPRMSALAVRVQDAFVEYREFAYLRGPIKQGFILTLSLALAISLLAALWAGLLVARRMVRPVRELAEGTRLVAAGDFNTRLAVSHDDELGLLVRSFNVMTRNLREARREAEHNRYLLDAERAYLESVLQHLRSGVLAFDGDLRLRTANAAACAILECELPPGLQPFAGSLTLTEHCPLAAQFFAHLQDAIVSSEAQWSREVTVLTRTGRKVLMTRAVCLPDPGERRGVQVIVFDDVTDFLRVQRDAAWGEVARRLAHEIKNPLTPIQLSAERLSRRLGKVLEGGDREILDRSTRTIVQQVEAMKTLVNAFRDYAQAPRLALLPLEMNRLVRDVCELYRQEGGGGMEEASGPSRAGSGRSDALSGMTGTLPGAAEVTGGAVAGSRLVARNAGSSCLPVPEEGTVLRIGGGGGEAMQVFLRLDLQEPLPLVRADAGRLRQLLHNLLKNALEALHAPSPLPGGHPGGGTLSLGATPPHRERLSSPADIVSPRSPVAFLPQSPAKPVPAVPAMVRVSTRAILDADGRAVELRVEDNGPGVAAEIRECIFEPYRTDKPRGTGLGLAVAKKIVEEHGGIIACENAPSGGAVFIVRIPAAMNEEHP